MIVKGFLEEIHIWFSCLRFPHLGTALRRGAVLDLLFPLCQALFEPSRDFLFLTWVWCVLCVSPVGYSAAPARPCFLSLAPVLIEPGSDCQEVFECILYFLF